MTDDSTPTPPLVVAVSVAWGDMDAFGHVNNVQYFRYFETARIAYFEAAGVLRGGDIGPILGGTSCRFKAPVTYPDRLLVSARVVEIGTDRFRMEYRADSERLDRCAATGDAVVFGYDYSAGEKTELPSAWLRAFERLDGITSSLLR